MKKSNTEELKEKLNTCENLKIAIIDNNIMGFLVKLMRETDIIQFFETYDIILVPKWVEAEINDGQTRIDCLNHISTKKEVYIVDEKDYSDLANYQDQRAILILQASTLKLAPVIGKIREFTKKKNIEDLDYEELVDEIYNNILKSETCEVESERREKKKNAGEISICALSYIIGYYYNNVNSITIFTFDQDCYDFVKEAKEKLYSTTKIGTIPNDFNGIDQKSITFKSNDCILKELYEKDNDDAISEIIRVRSNDRKVRYTKKKEDGSIEENIKNIDTDSFIEFLNLKDVHLIF